MRYIKYLMLFFLLLPCRTLDAQSITDLEALLESNQVSLGADEYEDIINTLQRLQIAPVDLNSASFDSLKMLFFLSDTQIDHILDFRKKYGVFLHINELLLVPGINRRDLENVRQFIRIGEAKISDRFQAIRRGTSQEFIGRTRISLPRQEGYKNYDRSDFKTDEQYEKKINSRFQGPPLGVLIKYKLQVNKHFQFGFTLENDPGEAWFGKGQKYGFDFMSAHVYVTPRRFLDRIVLGDFRIQWGQGILMWSGFSSGKSSMAINNEKSGGGVLPYTSTDENRFLRGVAFTLKPSEKMTADLFVSYKKTDGDVTQPDTLAEEDLITASLYESGYHRNRNEMDKKHNLKEFTTGGSLKFNTTWFRLGVNGVYYHFTPSITLKDNIYNRFDDDGKKRFAGSLDYKTGFQQLYFFGETGISDNGTIATVNGVRFSGSSKVSLSMLYRRYDKKYVIRYASGFGEYSNTSNEEGVYAGITLNFLPGLKINAYYDYFRFFAPRYNSYIPGSGREWLGELTYTRKKSEHILRYKSEVKPENYKNIVMESVPRTKNDLRYQFKYLFNKRWEARIRANVAYYKKRTVKEYGYLLYNDLIYSSRKDRLKLQFRVALFDTDSYQSRIYAYENNVLYGYSFPAYYDKGLRSYLNLTYKASKMFTFYLKGGTIIYKNRESIGSSLTKVEGNKLYDLSFQIRAKF